MGKVPEFTWHKQVAAKNCQIVDCSAYDPYKDFKIDPSGYYVLIRPNFELYRIEVAICNKKHEIEIVFRGRSPQDIYHAITCHEKDNKCNLLSDKSHWAYLGKELKKAEIALATGNNAYFQE